MKTDRAGQSTVLTGKQIEMIRRELPKGKYRLIWDIAIYTGERWGAILKLKFFDVFDATGEIKEQITFRKETRKKSAGKIAKTRQVPIHAKLRESLKLFQPDATPYLFPGQNPLKPICFRSADLALRSALQKCGLDNKGISTHSTRRTFITRLSQAGVPLATIQNLVGHNDIQMTRRYIEADPDQQKRAIDQLNF